MSERAGDRKQNEKRAERNWLPRVTIAAVIVVALLAAASLAQMRDIERGLLSVTADQQDQYVQLVVQQINLKENRTDRQMVEKILGAIDGSASQYWTFSRDGTMLFVKDVSESGKYQGLPTSTYFQQGDAADFYNGLSTDQVEHAYVTVEGKDYIASGQAFKYGDSTYRLVLLTNQDVVLSNNQILGARSRLGALLGIMAALLLFSAVWLVVQRDRANRKWRETQRDNERLNKTVGRLNERIAHERVYDDARKQWNADTLPQFIGSLEKHRRRAWLATVDFGEETGASTPQEAEAARAAFMDRSSVMLGREAVRFADEDGQVLVLFLIEDEQQARDRLAEVLGSQSVPVTWRRVGWSGSQSDASEADNVPGAHPTDQGPDDAPARGVQPAAVTSTPDSPETGERDADAADAPADGAMVRESAKEAAVREETVQPAAHGTARIRDNETKRTWERQARRRAEADRLSPAKPSEGDSSQKGTE